jgi:transposase
MVAADARNVVAWSLTAGQTGDAPQGRQLIQALGPHHGRVALLMDCAYQDDATREMAAGLGLVPVVPPNPQRRQPWEYDKRLYRRRNQIERLFRRIKGWRRVFTRYDKLDVMFAAFITVVLIAEALR